MQTITFKRTSIVIDGASKSTGFKKFLNRLSVWAETKYQGKYVSWAAYIYDEDIDQLIIHRGISTNMLHKYFPTFQTVVDEGYRQTKKIDTTCHTKPRDDLQFQAINFLKNNTDSQKFLCLKPGDGKTYCAINFICQRKLIPLIIVDTDKILNQWKDSFLKFTDVKEEDIFIIAGTPTIKKLLKEKNNPYQIYLASVRTLASYCDGDWIKLDNLFSKLAIGIKVFDEAHVEWMNITYIDCFTNIKETLYLTATPGRSHYAEDQVYVNLFGSIHKFGNGVYGEDETNTGGPTPSKYIYYIDYHWKSKANEIDVASMSNVYGFDSNRYNDYLLEENKFILFTEFLVDKLLVNLYKKTPDLKVAIVINCNNLVQALYDYISQHSYFKNKKVGRFCGLVKNKEKELEKDIIITTLKGFNKGVDVPGLGIVINTINISSAILTEQLSGRLRYDKNIKKYYIQLTDDSFPQFKRNSSIRNRIMKKIALKNWKITND